MQKFQVKIYIPIKKYFTVFYNQLKLLLIIINYLCLNFCSYYKDNARQKIIIPI